MTESSPRSFAYGIVRVYSQPSSRSFSIPERLKTNCSISSRAFFFPRTNLLLFSTRSQSVTFITFDLATGFTPSRGRLARTFSFGVRLNGSRIWRGQFRL